GNAGARAGQRSDTVTKFGGSRLEVLREIIEHLRAVVPAYRSPSACRIGRLNRIAHVFAVAEAGLPDCPTLRIEDRVAVARVRARLLAADVELCRAIERRSVAGRVVRGKGRSARKIRRDGL